MTQGTIEVVGLVLFARHGVHEAEQQLGQRFVLDLLLELDLTDAARTDTLTDTVDYGEVAAVAEAAFRERRYYLIEAAAAHVASVLLAHFPRSNSVRVTVRKPSAAVPAAIDYVATSVTRNRDG